MINKLLTKRYNTHNCLENCIANYCDAAGVDFRPIFLYSWDFGYKNENLTIGEKIHYHLDFDLGVNRYFKIAKKYLNISFKEIRKSAETIMSFLLKGNVLLIKSDSFDTPWNLAYRKYHLPHFYILSFDKENKVINAIDSFCSQEPIDIIDLNLNSIKQIYLIDSNINNYQNLNKQLLKKEYIYILKRKREYKVYDLISLLAQELLSVESIQKLTLNPNDIANTILIRRISDIVHSRYNTKEFFNYLSFSPNHINTMSIICEKWESLKNLFIKVILSGKLKMLLRASEELSMISDMEKKLCDKIIETECV